MQLDTSPTAVPGPHCAAGAAVSGEPQMIGATERRDFLNSLLASATRGAAVAAPGTPARVSPSLSVETSDVRNLKESLTLLGADDTVSAGASFASGPAATFTHGGTVPAVTYERPRAQLSEESGDAAAAVDAALAAAASRAGGAAPH